MEARASGTRSNEAFHLRKQEPVDETGGESQEMFTSSLRRRCRCLGWRDHEEKKTHESQQHRRPLQRRHRQHLFLSLQGLNGDG